MHLAPAQHFGGLAHVGDAPVRAGADDRLVYLDVARLGDRARVRRQVRERHRGLDGRRVDLVHLGILGIRVGMVFRVGALGAPVQVGTRHVVHLDEAGLTARLDGHVGHGHALFDAHIPNGAARELHRAVQRAVHADHADDVQDDVLARDAGSQLSLDLEQDGFGHLEPCAPGGVAHAGVGGAHARGERAQRAIGAGVAVRADDEVARAHDALLGQKRVFHAHAAHLVVVGNALLAREIAHDLGLFGALDVLVGDVMVGHEGNLFGIEHLLDADLAEFLHGDGGGDVVGEHEVEIAFDQLARLHLVKARMGGENLLRHGHGTRHACSFFYLGSCERAPKRRSAQKRPSLYHAPTRQKPKAPQAPANMKRFPDMRYVIARKTSCGRQRGLSPACR